MLVFWGGNKTTRLWASVVHKDALEGWLCGQINKQLLPSYMHVILSSSQTVTKERFLKTKKKKNQKRTPRLSEVWRALHCQRISFFFEGRKKKNIQNIFKWQQYPSVSSPTQGGVKKLTSCPAGRLWSRMSGSALLRSSQSVVGEWWQAHGYKAGTVTGSPGSQRKKAAGPERSPLRACLPAPRQSLHIEWGIKKRKRQREMLASLRNLTEALWGAYKYVIMLTIVTRWFWEHFCRFIFTTSTQLKVLISP